MKDLHEVIPIQDTLCSGLGAIEHLDGNLVRLWFYVLQTPEDGEVKEKVVVAKIVALSTAIADAVLELVAAISEAPPGSTDAMH